MTTSSKKARSPARPKKRKRKSTESGRLGARIAYLALGSNRGDRRAHLERALRGISQISPVIGVSSFYRTDPVGFEAQPAFWNAVVAIRWSRSAERLLRTLQSIEEAVGRTPSFRNGPREIDIDILDLGGRRRRLSDPILPHPRMARRRFVLAPLAELAPEWKHPENGRTAAELLSALPKRPRATRVSSRSKGWRARRPGS
jgi:2-amino-4-hydroxy-6-hydroxymethyldihydropteridine diphosphokinase